MTSNDCFELGRQSYLNKDFYHTLLWMNEAMQRLHNDTAKTTTTTTKADILEYLAFAVFKQGEFGLSAQNRRPSPSTISHRVLFAGNIRSALDMTNELLQLSPNHERAAGNKMYYERELARKSTESTDRKLRGDDGSDELEKSVVQTTNPFGRNVLDTPERQLYESLCRNEVAPDLQLQAQLHCRYVTNTSPFLKIAPLKLEEAFLDPYIVIYHEVMSDNEIELIKQLAKPRFRRATVQNHKTGELEVANYRISKSAWLKNEEHKFVEDIARRVEDMTGLTTSTAEELQVVNYGIGGHYEPHFDFARKEEKNAFKSLGTGNRIATVLFYVSWFQINEIDSERLFIVLPLQ